MTAPTLLYTDLDQRPYLTDKVLDMFKHAGPGRDHAVCGEPHRMAMDPKKSDFDASMGVLVVTLDGHVQAALCICPYSDEQVTLWGPVFKDAFHQEFADGLLEQAKEALKKGDFTSYRILVDSRNRTMREFVINHGLQKFQDNIVFHKLLAKPADVPLHPVDKAHNDELAQVADLLDDAFPDNGHCSPGLEDRVKEGYIHYVIRVKQQIAGCAVVHRHQTRTWLSLICIDKNYRGQGLAHSLLNGVVNNEYGGNVHEIAFEVLANNDAARAVYEHCGFEKQWTSTIFAGPV